MTTVLDIRDIKKFYGSEVILYDVSLQVKQGEMIAVTGASGTGKTTLLSIIGLLQETSAGHIQILGESVDGLDAAKRAGVRSRYIGFVFQRARLVGSLTALENVLVPSWLFGSGTSYEVRARQVLTELGLGKRLHYLPEQLSVGQMRRVALARALLLNPPLILADEPTNDLDPATAAIVFGHLQAAQQEGAAVILVTHDEEFAAKAQQVVTLKNGKLSAG
ncbi:hypothetical protein P22_3204 [Propionispora sp. 2/2-37]|uniref:ABC transporter ATP-binding protein n=1 Tax=Propionispora sp. 2/2-37 TaxID=1677858 RepID=UPI0006BB6610|nr:ABC transporter ATP-binding protein [Propionispora sp. 2/2-37]CUH97078.1 hypothetical protein P22_3204 [Propionispora sp. 2/2-37]